MNHELDNWIFNYEASQRQKYAKFLQDIKHEFIQRTSQQHSDRLDSFSQGSPPQPSVAAQRNPTGRGRRRGKV